MRYYEIYYPGFEQPDIATNVRRLKNLPEGTKIFLTITESDGTLLERDEMPIVDGRVKFPRGNKQTPKMYYG